jgi:myo-inositol-1(or 4)-monophosphatase
MALRSATINVMVKAAQKAARGLVRDFGEVEQLQVSQKGPADFVSTADLQAERTIRQELTRARPEFGLLMEEGSNQPSTDGRHRWIVDPLDGTLNFLHGLPHFAISIALERDAEIVAGVIYDPIKDEMYWGERGVGAYLNDRRLRVSGRRELGQAVIATGVPNIGRPDHAPYLEMLAGVMAQTAGIRRFGAAALDLAYVAAGRYDGYFEVGLSPWDIAAGILLVREAGGYVSEIAGGHNMLQSGSILAGNDHLHLPLGSLLRGTNAAKRAAV